MKKKKLSSLQLNKKSISNFEPIKGGEASLFPCSASMLPSCLICTRPDPDPSTYTDMPSWHNTVCDGCI